MAAAFNVDLSMREPPAEAQARAVTALKDPAHAVGLRLTKRGPGELSYRPRVQFPFVIMLWHNLNRERMTVTFAPAPWPGVGRAAGLRVVERDLGASRNGCQLLRDSPSRAARSPRQSRRSCSSW